MNQDRPTLNVSSNSWTRIARARRGCGRLEWTGIPQHEMRPRKPRWMPRDEFVRKVLGHQADPGLTAELREMMPDTTDDIRIE